MNTRKRKKRAGVVYTPPDVACFLVRGTILPWLLAAAGEAEPRSFRPGGPVWQLLRQRPDRYLCPELLCTEPLPTETAREVQERQARGEALRAVLRAGAIASVNDLLTYHLDSRRLCLDLLTAPGLSAIRAALAAAAQRITVLDPTCGDGALLQAALQLLQEIQRTLDPACKARSQALLGNLYGVDVRSATVAACRANLLRALPDDPAYPTSANIRCGDALTPAFWQRAFPAIQQAGGFDVIVGNPPYLSAERDARTALLKTANCPDMYAWILERAAALLKPGGRTGMIVPLSLAFSRDFAACRQLLFATYAANWFSAYGRIPSALFDFDIRVRNVIHLGHKAREGPQAPARPLTTRLHRWYDEARPQLFPLLHYVPFRPECWGGRVPLLHSTPLAEALEDRLTTTTARLSDNWSPRPTPHVLWYKQTAYNWLTFCRQLPPCLDAQGHPAAQTQFDALYFPTAWQRDLALLLLNGKLAFAYWSIVGDDFHVARWMCGGFPLDLPALPLPLRRRLLAQVPRLERALQRATAFKRNAGKQVGTYNLARCRPVTDTTDRLFADWLGWGKLWPEIELLIAQQVKTAVEAMA